MNEKQHTSKSKEKLTLQSGTYYRRTIKHVPNAQLLSDISAVFVLMYSKICGWLNNRTKML
jgi:hypothetical protein